MAPMDRDEALRLLRGGQSGVQEWNELMDRGEEIPDLGSTFLLNSNLRGIDLGGAFLVDASLAHADLRDANLAAAQLSGVDFRGSDLRGAHLQHANLTGAIFGGTTISCDLSKTGGLDSVVHLSRSFVDVHSLLLFKGKMPLTFLRGAGLAEEEIAHFSRRASRRTENPSCFICHCDADGGFASRLHDDLQSVGLRCWKWNHDGRICEELLGDTDLPLGANDKIVLVASMHSLTSESVNREIERIIEEEDARETLQQAGKPACSTNLLFPVRVDGFIFEQSPDGQPLWKHAHR
ncbi:toll/interleukin-1 receptor domain-containing protein, partial [Candidatus Bipolaricaulota bacterium]|nr:toll/interleukin-1 receptor domain-containing protein [Candidatus Bipolaricaulota bacterium]